MTKRPEDDRWRGFIKRNGSSCKKTKGQELRRGEPQYYMLRTPCRPKWNLQFERINNCFKLWSASITLRGETELQREKRGIDDKIEFGTKACFIGLTCVQTLNSRVDDPLLTDGEKKKLQPTSIFMYFWYFFQMKHTVVLFYIPSSACLPFSHSRVNLNGLITISS